MIQSTVKIAHQAVSAAQRKDPPFDPAADQVNPGETVVSQGSQFGQNWDEFRLFFLGELVRELEVDWEAAWPVTLKFVFTGGGCFLAVEPRFTPALGMARHSERRERTVPATLDVDPAEFQTGAIVEFRLAIQVEKVPKQRDGRLDPQISFAKDLELTQVAYVIGSQILESDVHKIQGVSKEFRSGRFKTPF